MSKNAKKKLEKRMKVAVAKYPPRTFDPTRPEILRQIAPDVGDMLALSLQRIVWMMCNNYACTDVCAIYMSTVVAQRACYANLCAPVST